MTKIKTYFKHLFTLTLALMLTACGDTSDGNNNGNTGSEAAYTLYDQSDSLTQYKTSSKLLNTLFKGVDPTRFFESNGRVSLDESSEEFSLQTIRHTLDTPLDSREFIFYELDDFFTFDTRGKPLQYPLATLYEMPLSSDYFNFWMAYILSNTILFSPAVELESVEELDAQRVYHRLVSMLDEGKGISEIVYEHMTSQENWRRFRSPEDNTREMMEIFLGRFIDEEVPLAAKACQNWYLTDDTQDYQLVKTFNVNETAQTLLDTELTTCEEFYEKVSTHPSLLPRIIEILVNYFFDGYSEAEKELLTATFAAKGYTHFKPLFIDIIFSDSYLFNTERPKKYEELFLGTGETIKWQAYASFFRYLSSDYTWFETLKKMNQATMEYKLGRNGSVPQDSLSFSNVHNSVRDRLFFDRKTDAFNDNDGGWQADFVDIAFANGTDLTDYVFVSLLGRKASEEEKTALEGVFEAEGLTRNDYKTVVIMDYISRLSEFYYFR